jgi:hypothetical protein
MANFEMVEGVEPRTRLEPRERREGNRNVAKTVFGELNVPASHRAGTGTRPYENPTL